MAGLRIPPQLTRRASAPLTGLTVGALPATSALAVVVPIPQDTGALVHARAGFAEVDQSFGFYKIEGVQQAQPESAPKAP